MLSVKTRLDHLTVLAFKDIQEMVWDVPVRSEEYVVSFKVGCWDLHEFYVGSVDRNKTKTLW